MSDNHFHPPTRKYSCRLDSRKFMWSEGAHWTLALVMDGLTQPGILEYTVAELHYLRSYLRTEEPVRLPGVFLRCNKTALIVSNDKADAPVSWCHYQKWPHPSDGGVTGDVCVMTGEIGDERLEWRRRVGWWVDWEVLGVQAGRGGECVAVMRRPTFYSGRPGKRWSHWGALQRAEEHPLQSV